MFCDKPHINQLTALLLKYGFQDIVVCPGSRNGILVHNFNAAHFRLHPVTDERSAAFVALGLTLSTQRPVALCVTSGTALLNTMPAVAEAAFRQLPLFIISADRPRHWIGQLDGQTLAQNNALLPYAPTYTIGETQNKEEEHWNMLQANEALLALHHNGGQPVHLNVPISEPLFTFQTTSLPKVDLVCEEYATATHPFSETLINRIRNARFPILIMGQFERGQLSAFNRIDEQGSLLLLPEIVSGQQGSWRTTALEHLLPELDFHPDLVIHIGGNLVNKQLKLKLRKLNDCEVIRVEPTILMPDTFCHLRTIVRTSAEAALIQMAEQLKTENMEVRKYKKILDNFSTCGKKYITEKFSDLGILQRLHPILPAQTILQVGNSSVIRNVAYFFTDHADQLFCNRGVNGIEGSLSTAVGYAKGSKKMTLSLIGDLSFFYDQNALWNKELPSNLRILLFNNGGGQIFYRLPGLDQTPALSPYIAAVHQTSAKGIAESYGLTYVAAHNYDEADKGFIQLLNKESKRPVLLEVFTNTSDNEQELEKIKQYYKTR